MRARLHQSGFTLIELTIVLIIIGLVAAIGVPVYRQIQPGLALNSATRDLASDLRQAQQLAVTEQDNYAVSFDVWQNRYAVANIQTGEVIKTITINPQIAIQSITGLTDNTANFNATGAVTESGDLVLVNHRNQTATIQIKPSGYVKIQD